MTDVRIGPDKEVTLHFALKLENGDLVDSTFDKQPATFKFGDGNLLPGFELALQGLKAGDKRSLRIEPEHGFGPSNPQNAQAMPRGQFESMELSEGLMVIFQDAGTGEVLRVVSGPDEQQVTVDLSHPLAGKALGFEGEMLDVKRVRRHRPPVWGTGPLVGAGVSRPTGVGPARWCAAKT